MISITFFVFLKSQFPRKPETIFPAPVSFWNFQGCIAVHLSRSNAGHSPPARNPIEFIGILQKYGWHISCFFVVAVLGGNSDIIPQRLGSVNNFFQLFPQRKFCFFAVYFYNIISFSHLSTTFYSYFSWLLRDFFKQEEKAQKKKSLQIKIFFYSYW